MRKRKSGDKTRVRRGLSVKWNIFLWLAIFTAAIIAVLWLCQVVFLDDIYKTIKIAEIESSARDITEHINDPDLAGYADTVANRREVCILILLMEDSDNGVAVVTVHFEPNCAIHNTDKQSKFALYDSALANGGKLLQRFRYDGQNHTYYSTDDGFYEDSADIESIIYSIVTTNSRGESMFIMLNSVISPVSATVRTLNILLAVISVLLVLLALVIAAIISRRVSRPISRLNDAAKKLALRNYEPNFTEKGYREVAELGETLNYAARELSKVDDLCRELIANISHDLRTPLTMITGYSEVMRDLPGENTPENIQIIIDEANRLTTLVNDVLDISRFQSGRQKFEPAPFNLTESVRRTVGRYAKLTERDGYVFSFDSDREVVVSSDETRITQVLCNLINNAMTYTGADKRVSVKQRMTEEGRVRIEVIDTGEGIAEDKLDLIWERYYKVDKVHKRAAVGSGLGLSIVRQIMTMAGGECGVRSMTGWGSTFWFELDEYKEADIQSETDKTEDSQEQKSGEQ